jgi:hypothetical protein
MYHALVIKVQLFLLDSEAFRWLLSAGTLLGISSDASEAHTRHRRFHGREGFLFFFNDET